MTGGGYDIDLLARLWAYLLAEMLEVRLPEAIPADWLAMARARAGVNFTPELSGDTPLTIGADERARADAQAYEVIDIARDLFGLTSR